MDNGIPRVTPGQNIEMHFQLIECRSRDDEEHKNAPEMRITIPNRPAQVRWQGPPRERFLTDNLTERVRPFTVALTASDQSGADGTQLVVSDGQEPKLTHQLRWIVAAVIQASPPLLTINDDTKAVTKTLALSGIDGQHFTIIDARSNLPGVAVAPRESDGTHHVLDVTIDPNTIDDARHLGEIIITTDLAAQRSVKVPIVIASQEGAP